MSSSKKNDPAINKLCRRCVRNCRQGESVLLLNCPSFLPRPFKSEELEFTQLDLFAPSVRKD
ncbi:MAG: hypothetical protein L3J63_06615 [Geopsychrobacter sp.]|nr:hypothetical protein [Geopsychrobacter sp.]